jgi:hypothetical protein
MAKRTSDQPKQAADRTPEERPADKRPADLKPSKDKANAVKGGPFRK